MENTMSKKKKAIIATSVVTAVVLVLIISLCIAFAPRKLQNTVPLENIEKITARYEGIQNKDGEKGIQELNSEEKEYLLNTLKKTSYKPIYDEIRTQGPIIFYIYYTNGDVAELQQYRMSITDKDGKTKIYKTIELDFDYKAFKDMASAS